MNYRVLDLVPEMIVICNLEVNVMVKTNAQKQKEFRERMKLAGMVQLNTWVHKDDLDDIKEYIRFKAESRQKKNQQ